MKITQELTLDISRDNSYKIVRAKQYDEDSRFLKITITNRGEIIKVPSGATVILGVKRADSECGDFAGTVNTKDGTVTVPLPNWMLQVAGKSVCDISIIKDGERFSTSNFNVLVEDAPTNETDITEDENYDILISLIERIENAIDEPDDPDDPDNPDVPIVIDENVINKILDPDNYPLEENTDIASYDVAIEVGKLSRSSGAERDDEGGLRMDDFVPIEYAYSYVRFIFDTTSDGVDRLCLIAYKADYSIALDAAGAGWYQYVSSGYDYAYTDLQLPEEAVYLRGYLSSDDTSTGGIISAIFSNGDEGVKKAEHKKIYIADHGYSIYGDEIDDATMHKIVIKAEGKDGNSYNITEIKAPTDNPEEATLALMNWGNGRKQFVDFSSMTYDPEKPTVEIVCQTRGGEPLPEFSVRYNSGDGNGRVKKFIVQPDAIPIELTASGLKVRSNNNFDNDGEDTEFATINLFELAAQNMNSIAVLKSPSGKRFQLTVDDNGTLTTTEIV